MTKSSATFLCIVAICFFQGLRDVDAIEDDETRFPNLISSANLSASALKDLHSEASEVLYGKLSRYISMKLGEAVRHDLNRVRALVANSSNTDTNVCYIRAQQKVREVAENAFLEMKPCNDAAIEIVEGYMSNLTQSIELAQYVIQNLVAVEAMCLAAEDLEECMNRIFPDAEIAVMLLRENVSVGLSNIVTVGEQATLEGTAECLEDVFDNLRAKTQEIVPEIYECLDALIRADS